MQCASCAGSTNLYRPYRIIQEHIYIKYMAHQQSKQSRAPELFLWDAPSKNHEIAFFLTFFVYSNYSFCRSFRKNQVTIFRCHLRCAHPTRSYFPPQNFQNTALLLLLNFSACKKAVTHSLYTRFKYKRVSERNSVAEIISKQSD